MIRINLVLLLAVLASALYLVNIQYESRRLFMELDRAQAEQRRLATEFERLQVEKRAQATSGRVERIAREKLQMRLVMPAITTYVSYADAAAASPDGAVGAPVQASVAADQGSTSAGGVQP